MALPLPHTFRDSFRQQRTARTHKPRRTPLLVHAGRLTARLLPTWAGFRRAVLSVAGFGCLSYSAWQISTALGLAAAGLSLLVLEALSGSD